MKRMFAFLMAAIMALPLICTTALAEEDTGHTFVVDNTVEGYEYTLYQMFTGDIAPNPASKDDDDKYILSNVKWGSSVLPETQAAMYSMFNLPADKHNATGVAEAIVEAYDSDSNLFHNMMAYMAAQGKTGGASLQPYKNLALGTYTVNESETTGYGATGIPNGYYLVRNTAVPSGDPNAAYSDYIIKVVGADLIANTKAETTNTIKQLQDVNDSNSEGLSSLKDSADYDIGDAIPYTLTATLPMNYGAYTNNILVEGKRQSAYYLRFEDDMCQGLTWDGTAKIYYGDDTVGEDITFTALKGDKITVDGQEITPNSAYDNGTIWSYDCGNLKVTHPELDAEDTIRVEYTATLNSHALIGSTGNKNQHRIIFSNNPTSPSDLTSSAYDVNVVYTYKTVFHKVNEKEQPLNGADFALEKYIASTDTWVDVTELHAGDNNPYKTGDASGSTFTFYGLDDGQYRLTETVTPAGYNTIDPIEFEISATHTDGDVPELTELSGTDGDSFTMESDVTLATLTSTIKNQPGVVLPASGGMGTTLLYVVGGILVAGSVVALVVKRRAQAE